MIEPCNVGTIYRFYLRENSPSAEERRELLKRTLIRLWGDNVKLEEFGLNGTLCLAVFSKSETK